MQAKRILQAAFLMAAVATPGGAQSQETEFGAVLAGARSGFWGAMEKGIAQAGVDLGARVVVRSPVDDDPQTVAQNLQIKMVRSLIQDGAKAIILAPMPVAGVPTPVEIPVPVVFVDRSSADFKGLSTISTDNYAAGRAAALTLQGYLSKGAKVGVLRLAPDVVSTTAREAGFVDATREMGFDVVVDVYLGHGIREPQAAVAAALASYSGRLDAIFTPTDFTTFGALRALAELPPEGRPRLVGFDYRPVFEDYLRSGDLHAFVVQDPFQMGYRAVQLLMEIQAGRHVPERVTIDALVVTAGNLGDPKIRTALNQYRD
ncbi:MAG TPA: substrate-binding domain-containing protein [Candidatus Angelobacter sp.]|nr:substrate-binding domain-containing protein [Candidatus Angelobacter sp.]